MNIFIIVLLILLVALLAFVLYFLIKKQPGDIPGKVQEKVDALLSDKFLNFQKSIHDDLGKTRGEVERSKDIISKHTIKTIETMKDMGQTIHKIIQQQEEAQKLGQSLKDILQVPKLRGSYGETILEEMLEKALPKGIWERQYTIDGREQVDAVIKFKDVIIPIDSKFPRDDYRRYLEAKTDSEKSDCWKRYETAVKTQIKSIASKYIKPEKGTSDFAIMFIPSEATYYETIAETNYLGTPSKLYEYAQENRVVPTSPNTFYAFLQIVIAGIKNLEIIKSAKKLRENLSSMEKSFEYFYTQFEEIGKQLRKSNEAYRKGEDHIQRYKKKLDSALKLEEFHGEVDSLPDQSSDENG